MFALISNVGIRNRLLAGFALICLLLAATVGYTVYAMSDISWRVKRVVDLRAPVAITSTQLVGNLYATLSTLRGYLLTGDAQGKQARAQMWAELDQTASAFNRMAENFTSAENKAIWSEAKALIGEFRQAQAKAEGIPSRLMPIPPPGYFRPRPRR
jgi:methyl-accepting chemotaxis protein